MQNGLKRCSIYSRGKCGTSAERFSWHHVFSVKTLLQVHGCLVNKIAPCSCPDLISVVLLQMSFAEELPDMDGTDLLGLLFQGEENGSVEPLFPVEDELMESWLSEQDVRHHVCIIVQA